MSVDAPAARVLEARLPAAVLAFGAPLAIGMGLQTTFNLVDAYLVSRLSAAEVGPSLGAIGICDQLAAVGTIVSYGLSTATAARIGRLHGAGAGDAVRALAWQSTWLVAGLAVIAGALGVATAPWLLGSAVGAKGQVAAVGAPYLAVMLGGSFSIFLLLQLTAILRALGSSKTPAGLLVASNVANLVLAVLFIYGPGDAPPAFAWGPPIARALGLPRWGLVGAAWATVLARTLALAPLVWIAVARFGLFRAASRTRLQRRVVLPLLAEAWPASAQLVVRIVAMLVTHAIVARAFTTATDQSATTALGVVFRWETAALFIGLGWGSAAQTFVAQNLGAGARGRARASGWIAAAYDVVAMVALAAAYIAAAGPIVAFFDPDARVGAIARDYLRIVAPSYAPLGLSIVLGSALTGARATRVTLALDVALVLAVQLPLEIAAATSGHARGPAGIFWAVVATNAAAAVAYVLAYRRVGALRGGAPTG